MEQKLANFHYVRPFGLMALLSSQKGSCLSVLAVCCLHNVLSNTELQDVTWVTLRKTMSLLLYVNRKFHNTCFGQAYIIHINYIQSNTTQLFILLRSISYIISFNDMFRL